MQVLNARLLCSHRQLRAVHQTAAVGHVDNKACCYCNLHLVTVMQKAAAAIPCRDFHQETEGGESSLRIKHASGASAAHAAHLATTELAIAQHGVQHVPRLHDKRRYLVTELLQQGHLPGCRKQKGVRLRVQAHTRVNRVLLR